MSVARRPGLSANRSILFPLDWKLLVKKEFGSDVKLPDHNNDAAWKEYYNNPKNQLAAFMATVETYRNLLKNYRENKNADTTAGIKPVHSEMVNYIKISIYQGHDAWLKKIEDCGFDFANSRGEYFRFIIIAMEREFSQTAVFLFNNSKNLMDDLLAKNEAKLSGFQIAAQVKSDNQQFLQLFVGHFKQELIDKIMDDNNNTLVDYAAQVGNINCLTYLLFAGGSNLTISNAILKLVEEKSDLNPRQIQCLRILEKFQHTDVSDRKNILLENRRISHSKKS